MSDKDPRFVVAQRPVNRRTAGARAAAPPKVAPAALERAQVARTRSRLGAPLAQQLRAPASGPRAPGPTAIAGGIVAACGGLGLFLGWLQQSILFGVAGTAAVAGGLLLARLRRRAPGELQVPAAPLFDAGAVEAFDRAVDQLAGELPGDVVQALSEFKQLVLRMARNSPAATVDEHFRVEDRLYANECLRRYVPDTLQAYLAVPREQRLAPLADGQTPQGLLLQQLALLRENMEKREAMLARAAAEALLRQQRFLDAKRD